MKITGRPLGLAARLRHRFASGRRALPWILAVLVLLSTPASLPVVGQDLSQAGSDPYEPLRYAMVEKQIRSRGIKQQEVLEALRAVPRHLFVPTAERSNAYDDRALPIGFDATISQPYVVGLMTELLELEGDEKILEIGTGSGYQAAVLSKMADEVYTIEIVQDLGDRARRTLRDLGYRNVFTRVGDGYAGWPDAAPFDAIILTVAPPRIPKPLIEQLKVGGRMVLPVGAGFQDLQVVIKTEKGLVPKKVGKVRFLPMLGEAQEGQDSDDHPNQPPPPPTAATRPPSIKK